jgi:hypothetical protein
LGTPEEFECRLLDPTPLRVASVLHNVDHHYLVLEADLRRHRVKIYDGLQRSLDNSIIRVINIIEQCGLVADFIFEYNLTMS